MSWGLNVSPEWSNLLRGKEFVFSGEAAHEAYRLVIEGDCIFDQMPFNLEVSTRSCCRRWLCLTLFIQDSSACSHQDFVIGINAHEPLVPTHAAFSCRAHWGKHASRRRNKPTHMKGKNCFSNIRIIAAHIFLWRFCSSEEIYRQSRYIFIGR